MATRPGAGAAPALNGNGFWNGRSVFVTGATGLVGGWLVRRLAAAGADVVALVRDWVPQSLLLQPPLLQRLRIVRGDVADQALLERVLGEYEVETVFHLAAQAIVEIANRNPVATFETNIAGTWRLLEACRRSPLVAEIVVASSDKAYGDAAHLPYDEQTPLAGRHPYDVSKSCADLLAQSYAATYDLPVAITRCGNLFGGGDLNFNRLVPGTIRSVRQGRAPVIRSDGTLIRDYFYVEDGAAAYMHLAEKLHQHPDLKGCAFNFSNETQVSVLELVERILRIARSPLRPEVRGGARHEIRHQFLSAARARERLGWSALYSLDDGLTRTLAWYDSYLQNESRSRPPAAPVEQVA